MAISGADKTGTTLARFHANRTDAQVGLTARYSPQYQKQLSGRGDVHRLSLLNGFTFVSVFFRFPFSKSFFSSVIF